MPDTPRPQRDEYVAASRIRATTFRHRSSRHQRQIESELVDLGEKEALEYLRGLGVEDSGVHALIRAVYHLLGLRTFLTTGEKETRAWTIHAGDKAPAAAGVIHSDFERGFIAAETISLRRSSLARFLCQGPRSRQSSAWKEKIT